MKSINYDVIIVGGGITGAGIALDTASRGFSTALFEKLDYASGTSSRSTKLVHGGLRYLKNYEFKLVRDTGTERAIAYQNAPYLVHPEKMLLPLIEGGSYGKILTRIGLWLYDFLAKVERKDRKKMLNSKQTIEKEPLIKKEQLIGGGFYSEYRTDDARLTLEIIKTASEKYQANCLNYSKITSFIYNNHQVVGIRVMDELTKEEYEVFGKTIINATGPWVDDLRKVDHSFHGKRLHHTKGVHLVFDYEKIPIKQSVYFDVPDGRMIFAIPREGITYVGTTDTNYKSQLEEPAVSKEDVTYLLDAVNNMFPSLNLKESDIISSWAGLRPLIHEDGKSPSELSRKDEIFFSESGLISIAGGKLTGYRLMAKKIADIIQKKLGSKNKCLTKNIALLGSEFNGSVSEYENQLMQKLSSHKFDPNKASYFVKYFGKHAETILQKGIEIQNLLKAEVWYCIHFEQCTNAMDYFNRRSGKLLFNPKAISSEKEKVVEYMAEYLHWDEATSSSQLHEINSELARITNFK